MRLTVRLLESTMQNCFRSVLPLLDFWVAELKCIYAVTIIESCPQQFYRFVWCKGWTNNVWLFSGSHWDHCTKTAHSFNRQASEMALLHANSCQDGLFSFFHVI